MSHRHNHWAAPESPLPVSGGDEAAAEAGPPPSGAFLVVAIVAFMTFWPELFVTFGLCFAPGWANWGGLSIQWVWPAGMTACVFVVMVTSGICLAGLIGAALGFSRQRRFARPVVVGWLVCWAALTALSCVLVGLYLRAAAVHMFPGGYPPAS